MLETKLMVTSHGGLEDTNRVHIPKRASRTSKPFDGDVLEKLR